MYSTTSGTVLDPEKIIESLAEERGRYKKALERIVALADPPEGPLAKECTGILTIAVLALENTE